MLTTLAVQAIVEGVSVAQVISGQPEEHPADFAAQACSPRQWQWDGVEFSRWQWAQGTNNNQKSCVLMVQAQGERLL